MESSNVNMLLSYGPMNGHAGCGEIAFDFVVANVPITTPRFPLVINANRKKILRFNHPTALLMNATAYVSVEKSEIKYLFRLPAYLELHI